jgi:hypothetical protein
VEIALCIQIRVTFSVSLSAERRLDGPFIFEGRIVRKTKGTEGKGDLFKRSQPWAVCGKRDPNLQFSYVASEVILREPLNAEVMTYEYAWIKGLAILGRQYTENPPD